MIIYYYTTQHFAATEIKTKLSLKRGGRIVNETRCRY